MITLACGLPAAAADTAGGVHAARVSSARSTDPIPQRVIDSALQSVGKVTSTGYGSGWIAAPDTVITNFHVARTTEIYFTPPNGRPLRCYRAAAIREGDVAALKCPTGRRPSLPLRRSPVAVGESVVMIGYPGGEGPSVTTGEVLETSRTINDIDTIGVSAAGAPGSSGSPIMDHQGRVVAVGTFGGVNGAAINGLKIAEVRELLDEAGYLPATQRAAEWRLRLIRGLVIGSLAAALGAFLQWRSGYPGIARRAARYALVAVLVTLAGTELQLWIDGPVHFV